MEKHPDVQPMRRRERFDFDAFERRIIDVIGEVVEVVPEPPELPPAA